MNTSFKVFKLGVLLFIPVSLLTFYFSAYACNDRYSIIQNCTTYQIILAIAAPFLLAIIVEKLNVRFAKKTPDNQSVVSSTTKKANRIFAIPVALLAFFIAYSYIGYAFYPDTSNSTEVVSLVISAVVALLVFMRLAKK